MKLALSNRKSKSTSRVRRRTCTVCHSAQHVVSQMEYMQYTIHLDRRDLCAVGAAFFETESYVSGPCEYSELLLDRIKMR